MFLLLGGVCHKCLFYKKIYFYERIKLRLVLSVTNTPFTFFAFLSPFACHFLNFFYLLILEELRNLHAKIETFSVKIDREINFQSWILFLLIFHECYNFAIVQWTVCSPRLSGPFGTFGSIFRLFVPELWPFS